MEDLAYLAKLHQKRIWKETDVGQEHDVSSNTQI